MKHKSIVWLLMLSPLNAQNRSEQNPVTVGPGRMSNVPPIETRQSEPTKQVVIPETRQPELTKAPEPSQAASPVPQSPTQAAPTSPAQTQRPVVPSVVTTSVIVPPSLSSIRTQPTLPSSSSQLPPVSSITKNLPTSAVPLVASITSILAPKPSVSPVLPNAPRPAKPGDESSGTNVSTGQDSSNASTSVVSKVLIGIGSVLGAIAVFYILIKFCIVPHERQRQKRKDNDEFSELLRNKSHDHNRSFEMQSQPVIVTVPSPRINPTLTQKKLNMFGKYAPKQPSKLSDSYKPFRNPDSFDIAPSPPTNSPPKPSTVVSPPLQVSRDILLESSLPQTFQNPTEPVIPATVKISGRKFYFNHNLDCSTITTYISSYLFPIEIDIVSTISVSAKTVNDITVNVGDILHVYDHKYIGWCYGMNLTTHAVGLFPYECLGIQLEQIRFINCGNGSYSLLEHVMNCFPSFITNHILDIPLLKQDVLKGDYTRLQDIFGYLNGSEEFIIHENCAVIVEDLKLICSMLGGKPSIQVVDDSFRL